MFCLPKFQADEFKQALKAGRIDPAKLMDMTSAERRAFFEEIVGKENAVKVNEGFESKMMLKDQKRGMITWAKQLTGIKPEVQRDILNRVNKMTEILEPAELDMFLEDLAAKRLGVGVSVEEAGKIAQLARDVQVADAARLPDRSFPSDEAKMKYGYARVDFIDYVNDLKIKAEERTPREILKDSINPVKAAENLSRLSGLSKSIKATLDVSGLLNQGMRMMLRHPDLWYKNGLKMFEDVYKVGMGKEAMRDVRAQVFSDPDYDTFVKMKLAIGGIEEAFPTSLPERLADAKGILSPLQIPGRAFKASEAAYNGFALRNRVALAKVTLKKAKAMGIDITDKEQLQDMGRLINSFTGRASLGRAEPLAGGLNNAFFSARFLKSQFDFLFDPLKRSTPFARKMAARNLFQVWGTLAGIMIAANAMRPDSFDLDPTSSTFGRFHLSGGHYFDVTGGQGTVVGLIARVLTLSTKSGTTGARHSLISGTFGATDGVDAINNFFDNKLAPLAGLVRDYLKGQNMNGEKFSLPAEAFGLLVPMPIGTFNSLRKDSNSAVTLLGMVMSQTGLNEVNYSGSSYSANKDKPIVLNEVYKKLADGDIEGATALAHDFNVKLHDQIKEEITQKNPNADSNTLDEKIDKQWRKDALYLPDQESIDKYKAGDMTVVEKTASNGKPSITQNAPLPIGGVVGAVVTYATAIGADPVTAFNDIFHGQVIRRVDNGTVIVERMSLAESEKVKKEGGGNNPSMKLDHTLPLQLGGDNQRDNLRLVTTEEWATYTPVENYLGTALRNGSATKQQAQQAIKDFKNGIKTFDEIKQDIPDASQE